VDSAGILALEARRYAAMIAVDIPALGALLHDELVYVHSSGTVDTRASYLEALASGATRYRVVERLGEDVRVIGAVALVQGRSRIDVVVKGVEKLLNLRSLAAWTETPQGWQFIAWQSCAVPA